MDNNRNPGNENASERSRRHLVDKDHPSTRPASNFASSPVDPPAQRRYGYEGVTAVDRELAAILPTDVAGFSRLRALDEERTVRALNLCHGRIAELVREHGGRIFGQHE